MSSRVAQKALAMFISLLLISFTCAHGTSAQAPVVSSDIISLDGNVFDPNTSSDVHITGFLHVVTQVTFFTSSVQITAHANLPAADATAVNPAGCTYIVHGAGSVTTTTTDIRLPANPIVPGFSVLKAPQHVDPEFCSPPGPSVPPLIDVLLQVSLSFSELGFLVPSASSATIVHNR